MITDAEVRSSLAALLPPAGQSAPWDGLDQVEAGRRYLALLAPRGLRFGPGGRLYCVGEDHVMAFDFSTGSFAGPVVHLARLNGQALVPVP